VRGIIPVLALAGLLFASDAGAQVPDETATVIFGRVTERGTGDAVSDASVVLEGLDVGRVSDRDGRFEFPKVAPGSYILRITHIGYETIADTLVVPPSSEMNLDVQLVTAAVELEPLVVVATYSMQGKMAAFHRRRRTAQAGHFITRADFEERHVAYVTDMLRRIPGLRMVPRRGGGMTVGNQVVMRGSCRPAIFIDGILSSTAGMTLDEMFRPDDIEGIEIYRGPETPSAYLQNQCGAILIWTRPGGRPEGKIPFWKMAIAGGLFVALALFFTR